MTKVDLVTGFLGAGKTTFLLEYAKELIRRGERIGIIENDYGAINVDLLLLQKELGDKCRLEMVIGGDPDCHRRRLKTKLIAMGIDRFDRVLVEPSGIFDVDEFMDLLYEEPLEHLMKSENVIAIVDAPAMLLRTNSPEERYVLAEELTKAGCVICSKSEELTDADLWQVTEYLNACLAEVGCNRKLSEAEMIRKPKEGFRPEDFDRLMAAGNRDYPYVKQTVLAEGGFRSVFFFHPELPEGSVSHLMQRIFSDPACGRLSRIKGFVRNRDLDSSLSEVRTADERREDAPWLEINATREKTEVRPSPVGQPVLIAIGEALSEEQIGSYWASYENEYRG